MASHRPFRTRPNLHLALTQQTGSPRNPNAITSTSSRFSSPFNTPTDTPLATTSYSPSASAKFAAPSPYVGSMHFTPRQRHKYRHYSRAAWFRAKRILSNRTSWLLLMAFLIVLWWASGGSEGFDTVKHGVYFDIRITNTTSLLLSLRNSLQAVRTPAPTFTTEPTATISNSGHLSFRPNSAAHKPAPPVSLLARLDQEEYVLLPNASGLVAICSGSLQRDAEHSIRIVAPMTEDNGTGILQLEGIWLDKGAQFGRIEGTLLHDDFSDEDLLSAENDQVGEKHRAGLTRLLKGSIHSVKGGPQPVLQEDEGIQDFRDRRKRLEIVTDTPGSYGRRRYSTRTGGADGLLAGVMGWEYLLGEMFGVDHVSIGIDGMCLTQDCIGGAGRPYGIGDIFFRSGPPGSIYVEHPWFFNSDVPDVLVINLGNADKASFDLYASEYNKTAWDLAERFENTYVSFVKAIRTLAYPKHPAIIQSERSGYRAYIPNFVPASVPIFIMRPLRGELEHSTQNIVNRLRADGDKAVFWLDTSGWLDPRPSSSSSPEQERNNEDFYTDDRIEPPKWRLSERGNQRVAIFLHMHLCRYLARNEEKCPFLPTEVYQGKVFDPSERDFERYVEGEKERKLRRLFWAEKESTVGGEASTMTATADRVDAR
ncbi:MAG: hypothetical protein LQ344_003466 [Seirophora lacunosa]|nr:MAG: hypothetical protein LQ344_003466 [Seirophora lacunosa]